MDLQTFEQRLKKFDVKLNIKPQGETSTITYEGVILSGKKYGPLWDLFKRYREDNISDKDLDSIDFVDSAVETEKQELVEEVTEEVLEVDELPEMYYLLKNNKDKKIKVTYLLFLEHEKDVQGIIHDVLPKYFSIFEPSGAQRVIAYADVIKYKL